jgi:16S rRNA G966 N2-methylase RsmD
VAAIEKLAKEWGVAVRGIVGDVLSAQSLVLRPPLLSTKHYALSTRYDVVYADPPYDFARYDDLLAVIDKLPLAPGALVAIEHRRKTELASETKHLRFARRAEYGEVWISIYAAEGE